MSRLTPELDADTAKRQSCSLGIVIDAKRRTLDAYDHEEIDDLDACVREQGDAVDRCEALVGPLNDALETLDAAVHRFKGRCAKLPCHQTDMTRALSVRDRRLAESIEREKKANGD